MPETIKDNLFPKSNPGPGIQIAPNGFTWAKPNYDNDRNELHFELTLKESLFARTLETIDIIIALIP